MSEPFLSEIKITPWSYAPRGWAMCNGQMLPINQNQALFALLGTTYGGNGQTTFALPDLRGRVPIHFTTGFTLGTVGGETAHTVSLNEMPAHTHFLMASSSNGNAPVPFGPNGNILATSVSAANPPTSIPMYAPVGNLTAMNAADVTNVGGSQPHQNMQPYLTLTFIIALIGIFPSRN